MFLPVPREWKWQPVPRFVVKGNLWQGKVPRGGESAAWKGISCRERD